MRVYRVAEKWFLQAAKNYMETGTRLVQLLEFKIICVWLALYRKAWSLQWSTLRRTIRKVYSATRTLQIRYLTLLRAAYEMCGYISIVHGTMPTNKVRKQDWEARSQCRCWFHRIYAYYVHRITWTRGLYFFSKAACIFFVTTSLKSLLTLSYYVLQDKKIYHMFHAPKPLWGSSCI